MENNLEMIVFNIICSAGDARGYAYEALSKAEEGDFVGADEALNKADEAFKEAHKVQTEIIQAEARGEKTELSVLFVHAQDHLMTAMEAKNLAGHIVKLHKKLAEK